MLGEHPIRLSSGSSASGLSLGIFLHGLFLDAHCEFPLNAVISRRQIPADGADERDDAGRNDGEPRHHGSFSRSFGQKIAAPATSTSGPTTIQLS